MCLISVIPKGIEKNREDLKGFIEQGMSSNTDGSGYAIKKNGKLFLNKGFRDSEILLNEIMKHKLTKKDELIIHHRIGTSGKKDAINMHPFLVTSDLEILKTTSGNTDLPIMAHNGVFRGFTRMNSDFSDTFHFIQELMSTPELLDLLKRDNVQFKKVLSDALGWNKLAFLFPDRDLLLLGDFQEDNGCYHSNGGYKKYVYNRGGVERDDESLHNRYTNRTKTNDTVLVKPNAVSNLIESKIAFDRLISKNICFEYNQIMIDVNNCDHFIIIPKIEISEEFKKDKAHSIEYYDVSGYETTCMNQLYGDKVCFWVDIDKCLFRCKIYVKNEFSEQYRGLDKLLKHINGNPSKKILKRMETLLNKNKGRRTPFRFKEFGNITWDNLNCVYNRYKRVPDSLQNELFAEGPSISNIIT